MKLFLNERIDVAGKNGLRKLAASDDAINRNYAKGEIRIVTEQARYPLNSIPIMLESGDYRINPEFQRRHRWDDNKKSGLIESFIMNVPVPPIFLYEDDFSHYEVMDGLQRLTAIKDFYANRFPLTGLLEWSELNGRTYQDLPEQIRRGIDRRYLSSIILLQETAKNDTEAQRLKQLVFDRINSGGVKLEPQESRNAIYPGPFNDLCLELSRNPYLCELWNIPRPDKREIAFKEPSRQLLANETYRKMDDVELVLRFFAYRQRLTNQRGALRVYLDHYLDQANRFSSSLRKQMADLFSETIELVAELFGEKAFWLYRQRNGQWSWYRRPTTVIYDPLMYVVSSYVDKRASLLKAAPRISRKLEDFYIENYELFEGRYTNLSNIEERNEKFGRFIARYVDA